MTARVVLFAAFMLPTSLSPAWAQLPLPPADFGDAPECVPAYPNNTVGKFPTCLESLCLPGTQEAECGAISTLPGPTGFIRHLPSAIGQNYWLGCHGSETSPAGLDLEPDGRMNSPGNDGCGAVVNCTEDAGQAWNTSMLFGQDECRFDGEDTGMHGHVYYASNCTIESSVIFEIHNAGAPANVYLNVLLDMNMDGDWNDSITICGCNREWAVKNVPLLLPSGCSQQVSPPFQAAQFDYDPYPYPTWVRVTVTDEAVDDDFPWRGSQGRADSAYHGGETEDFPAAILEADPVIPSTWGELKLRYR